MTALVLCALLATPDAAGHPWLPGDRPASVSVGTTRDGYLVGDEAVPDDDPILRVLPTQAARGLRYGTAPLVRALGRAAHAVAAAFPGSVTWLGNLSQRGGGDIPWSVSHNSGRDADIAFPLLDPAGLPAFRNDLVELDEHGWAFDADGAVRLDAARVWVLVSALLADPDVVVQYLFVSRPLRALILSRGERRGAGPDELKRAARVLVQPGGALPHDDHLHLRIHCTAADAANGCREAGPQRDGAVDVRAVAAARAERALPLLGHADAEVRARAAHLLGLLGLGLASDALAGALRDPDARVRRRAACSLVDLRARDRWEALARAVREERDAEAAYELAWALAELAPRRAPAALQGLLDSTALLTSGRPLRAEVAALLGDTSQATAVPRLLDLLLDPHPEVGHAAGVALARVANLDLGVDYDLWRSWWRTHARETRAEWVAAGFRAVGLAVEGPVGRRHVPVLVGAVGSPEPHLSENARRELMRVTRVRDAKQLMWPPRDAEWYWRARASRLRR